MNKHQILPIFFAIVALAIGIYSGIKPNNNASYPLNGYTLTTLKGDLLNLGQLKGKIVVLNFWATWCPPCLEEIPELSKLYPQLQNQQIELIGIAIDSSDNIQKLLATTSISYPIVLAGANGMMLGKQLGNQQGGLPFTVILDEDGNKIFSKAGKIPMTAITDALQR